MSSPDFHWKTPSLDVLFHIADDGVVNLRGVVPPGSAAQKSVSPFFADPSLPLVEIRLAGEGSAQKTSRALIGGAVSLRLKYRNHVERTDGSAQSIEITMFDDVSGLEVKTTLQVYGNIPVLRMFSDVTNTSDNEVCLTYVSSIVLGGLSARRQEWWHDYIAKSATNTWFREAQWREHTLPDLGIDSYGIHDYLPDPCGHGCFSLSNRGNYSTSAYLPMGMLKQRDDSETWLWQIESNGAWRWDIGDWKDSVYLAACGAEALDHDWRKPLGKDQAFRTTPVALCHVFEGEDAAFSALTAYRRQIRRDHSDLQQLPIIFNDYMNCLMGDPDEEKLSSLIPVVAKTGAEYFVIDAGWFAESGPYWDTVGEWEVSKSRFPSGFDHIVAKIKASGMLPGLWMEPEMVGVRSTIAAELPDNCFFMDGTSRMLEKSRYQLDFRNEAVRSRMHGIISKLILAYDIAYFKFDYNVEISAGTTYNTPSRGVGQQDHNRAYLQWISELLDQHKGLVIENCSGGGQRMDYASLAVHPVQSVSDQQDPVRYAAIAAAAPTAVTPEQGANWVYPQQSWTPEINAMTVINGLMGRVHLSGQIDKLNSEQLALVSEGMALYKGIRTDLRQGLPFWPLGLPSWHSHWVALGLEVQEGHAYVAVWRRGGPKTCNLPLMKWKGQKSVTIQVLYPKGFETKVKWDPVEGFLEIGLPDTVCARFLELVAS